MRIEARAFVTERLWDAPCSMIDLVLYRLSVVHDLNSSAAAMSGDVPLRVMTGSAADKALKDAALRHAELRMTLDVPGDGEAACDACKGTLLASSCPAKAKKGDRRRPIGGAPKDFCICGHHGMCHANYADMPRACNQTACGCEGYRPEVTDERVMELIEASEAWPHGTKFIDPCAAFRDVATLLRELLDRRKP